MPATPKAGSLGVTLAGGSMIDVPAPHEGPEFSGAPGFSSQTLFAVTAGALPPGITIAQKAVGTGTTNQFGWKGTPTELGVFTATIGASGAYPGGDFEWTISLLGGCPLVDVDPASPLDDLLQGFATVIRLQPSGGVAPYTFDLVTGTLPTGMSLSAAGVISGTPTVPGDYTFTIRATDDNGCPGITVYSVTVRGIRIDVAEGSPATLVDHTADVLQADFDLGLNQRSTARLVFGENLIPDRGAEVILYARDGVTKVFGGIILRRRTYGFESNGLPNKTDADCVDFSVYFDDASVTLSYDTAVAVEDVIEDIVDQVLGDYGLTYTPSATGLTMQPFSWTDVVVTTALKQISDKTGLVFRVTPNKEILAFVPGATASPITITDADRQHFDLEWQDGERLAANTVELFCGPPGPGLMSQQWVADGVETSWVTDLPAIDPPPILVEVDDGVTPRRATVVPLGAGGGAFEWDRDTHTLSLGTDPTPSAGTILRLGVTPNFPDSPFTYYTVQFPFKVTVPASPPTPRNTYRETRPDVVEYAAALEIAEGLLARESVPRRDLQVTHDVDGFLPGQALTVDTTSRGGLEAEFLIASVRAHLITAEIWHYTVTAQQAAPGSPLASLYHGSYVDEWKALTGGAGTAGSSATVPAPVVDTSPVTESDLFLSDVTTANVSTSKHGFAPKAPGDATKFLNGANPPAWAVPAGSAGALILLEQHTASASASLDFTTAFTSTYDDYVIELVDILPATDAVSLRMLASTNGGSSYDTGTNYATSYHRWSKTGASQAGAASDSNIDLGGGLALSNDATEQGFSGTLHWVNPLGTSGWKKLHGQSAWWYSGTPELIGAVLAAAYKSASAVNAVRFVMSSGNIASGTVRVYGVAK